MGYRGLIDSHQFIPYARSVGEYPACGGLQEGRPIRGDPCTSKTLSESIISLSSSDIREKASRGRMVGESPASDDSIR